MAISKAQFIAMVAEDTGFTVKDTKEVVESTLATLASQLSANEEISFQGFGKFGVKHRAARKGRNPQTGEDMTFKAAQVPYFKPSKGLKDALNL